MVQPLEPARVMELISQPADPAGQYMQLCLCYPAAGKSCSFVIRQLERGLAKLAELLPWLACSNRSAPEGPVPIVIRMSCRPTYGEITSSLFPFRWLGEDSISPLPSPGSEPLLVQINFMPDGLGLVFCGHRGVMDSSRFSLVLSLLHCFCVGADVNAEDLAFANVNRTLAEVPVARQPREFDEAGEFEAIKSDPAGQWFYFSLNAEIFSDAESRNTENRICAFVLKAVVSAKRRVYKWLPSRPVVLARTSVPPTTTDLTLASVGTAVFTTYTLGTVLGKSVADLASGLEGPELSSSAESDLVLHSWLHLPAYSWSFGLGPPTAVRVPSSAPLPGVGYILPRNQSESPIIGLCLRSMEIEMLRSDPLFEESARFIG